MTLLQGRTVVGGKASGHALVSHAPINITASFTKMVNILKGKRSQIQDRHHELFKKHIKGRILVFPESIGSTYAGMVFLDLVYQKQAPAGIIVKHADSLLVAGSILAETWFGHGIPIVEYDHDNLFEKIRDGSMVKINGDTGEITAD